MALQTTIKNYFSLEGKGIQTGRPVKMSFYPESENKGVIFTRKDLKDKPAISIKNLSSLNTDRRTRIDAGFVETVEHLLAATWGAGIDNLRIELDSSEPPALDGSAAKFLEALKSAGTVEQNALRESIKIKEPIWVEEKESFLGIFPSEEFKISYILEYPSKAIGRQFFSETVDRDIFQKRIAPARTFCLKEEVEALLKQGYGKGADLKNTLVMTEEGPMENELRFPDEPVRHKVLDLIGDLCLLGSPVEGRVIAIRSGHRLNLKLVEKIKEILCR
ncbi:UDP-3-O-acyl-N-acetylglucosamine deacetylase [Candidatus Omnitrophota bacterium]